MLNKLQFKWFWIIWAVLTNKRFKWWFGATIKYALRHYNCKHGQGASDVLIFKYKYFKKIFNIKKYDKRIKIKYGFKSKTQIPLFMVWKEYIDNNKVYYANTIFSSSQLKIKKVCNWKTRNKIILLDSLQWVIYGITASVLLYLYKTLVTHLLSVFLLY